MAGASIGPGHFISFPIQKGNKKRFQTHLPYPQDNRVKRLFLSPSPASQAIECAECGVGEGKLIARLP